VSCFAKKQRLTERKRNGTDAESEARQSAEDQRPRRIYFSRSVRRNRAADQGKEQEEASSVFVIDIRCGNDVRNAVQRETQIDSAEYDRSQARSARVQQSNPSSDLSGHEAAAEDGAQRQVPDMLQVLPGSSVVPHQRDDAKQHRRRAKDDPPAERPLHTAKLTETSTQTGDFGVP
jgi:hypothetical protein